MPAFCVNYTAVHLYSGGAWLCVNDQWWRIGETTAVVLMRRLCVKGATYSSKGWIWTGSCVAILPSHTARQVCGSECRDFSFDMCIVTALVIMYICSSTVLRYSFEALILNMSFLITKYIVSF